MKNDDGVFSLFYIKPYLFSHSVEKRGKISVQVKKYRE